MGILQELVRASAFSSLVFYLLEHGASCTDVESLVLLANSRYMVLGTRKLQLASYHLCSHYFVYSQSQTVIC